MSSHASGSGSGSSSRSKSRTRTFTSCTECRRRKQRCNQAKDRPCNNCARRYPPVICTYESGGSPPPSHDHLIDLHDHSTPSSSSGLTPTNYNSSNAYTPTSSSSYSQPHTSPASSQGFYTAPTSTGYTAGAGYGSNVAYSAAYVPTTNSGYYSADQVSYAASTSAAEGSGYYTAGGTDQWYDDGVGYEDVGDDYYYVDEPNQGHQGR